MKHTARGVLAVIMFGVRRRHRGASAWADRRTADVDTIFTFPCSLEPISGRFVGLSHLHHDVPS